MHFKNIIFIILFVAMLKPLWANTENKVNGSLKDECQIFFEWFEEVLNEDNNVKGNMLNLYNSGIDGVPYNILDWCAKHKLLRLK